MRTKRLIVGHALLIALAMCLLPSFAAFGDDDTKPAAKPAASDTGNLLAGPKVAEEPGDSDNPTFSGEDRMRETIEIPPQRWFIVVRELTLSDEQRAQVDDISSEFQDAGREFRKAHQEEIRAIQQEAAEARKNGTPNPKLRDKLREIQKAAPDAAPYQERIWKLLDETQQADMKDRLEKMRAEIAERRAKERESAIGMQMRGGSDRDTMAPGRDDDNAKADRAPQRGAEPGRAGAAGAMWPGIELDAMARRRLEFLMSRHSKDAPAMRPMLDRARQRGAGTNDRPNDQKPGAKPAPARPRPPRKPADDTSKP